MPAWLLSVLWAGTRVVFLDFPEQSEEIVKDARDAADESPMRSAFCGARIRGRWCLQGDGCGGCPGCGGSARQQKVKVANRMQKLFQPFDLVFATRRPAQGPYSAVVMGGQEDRDACQFPAAVNGYAPLDCGTAAESHVGFSFACDQDLDLCAAVAAQELAHTFGLVHTSGPDLMRPDGCPTCDGFLDRSLPTVGSDALLCQPSAVQNSYRTLLDKLGAWEGGEKPADWLGDDTPTPQTSLVGCSLPPRPAARPGLALDAIACLAALFARARRRK